MNRTPKDADLVLEGGGVLGIAHVAAVSAFQEKGYAFHRVAGTSAGAIVGALVAARMPTEQMQALMGEVDYRRFEDRTMLDRVPLFGPLGSLLFENGIYEGDYLREWLGNLLADLHVETFADLRIDDDPAGALRPEQRYRLVVMVTDLTTGQLVRLPWEYADRYGLDPDQQLVVDAVRASMSIPFFYEPVRLERADGGESVLVDGGVLSNFPIDAFDRTDGKPPRWPTFGVKLMSPLPAADPKLLPLAGLSRRGPLRLLEQLIATMIAGQDRSFLAQPWITARTVQVDTDGISPFDFGLDKAAQELLYRNGLRAAESFLGSWDWEDYLARHRQPGVAATNAS